MTRFLFIPNSLIPALFCLLLSGCHRNQNIAADSPKILPPEELYGQLFYDVQSDSSIFGDSKTFVDCIPIINVDTLLQAYAMLHNKSAAGIAAFVRKHFILPQTGPVYKTDSCGIHEHIVHLWQVLKRAPDKKRSGTLIPLPCPYIVPGGRFREVYYWDSYFTMLGLQADGQFETIQQMTDNFSWLISKYGFIPNGNRTYYLSRSQPPFYALMVSLLADIKTDSVYVSRLQCLEKEYAFWMNGAGKLSDTLRAWRRVVKMPGGELLNRYWDEKNTPRAESYLEDLHTAAEASAKLKKYNAGTLFRNIRAAAESGWDFSSRWLLPDSTKKFHLYTIHTTDIVPVDLNCLLYNLERTLAKSYLLSGDSAKAGTYQLKCEARRRAIIRYCWSPEQRYFMDFDVAANSRTSVLSLAGVFPLFFNIASAAQAQAVENKIASVFLKPGGLVTTTNVTGQQWDAPNGWAPLQWISIKALRNYGFSSTAKTVKYRWMALNRKVYDSTYKLLEKYNVQDLSKKGGGGEYPNQDGFGWTNGVYEKLLSEQQEK